MNIFLSQTVHTATFTIRKSEHEKSTKHRNTTSNADLCTNDRLTEQITVLINFNLHTIEGV